MNLKLLMTTSAVVFICGLAAPAFTQTLVARANPAAAPGVTSPTLLNLERLAAAGDHWAAEFAGRMRYAGKAPDGPVTRDLDLAQRHLELAAKHGSPGAIMLLERIRTGLGANAETEYVPGPGGC
ncbi:MAG: hypothetical protein HYZ17_01825 [Betaproteobacteria bacterium]|nr:hypothetical protein [Betaproteobacteria bacterium]